MQSFRRTLQVKDIHIILPYINNQNLLTIISIETRVEERYVADGQCVLIKC